MKLFVMCLDGLDPGLRDKFRDSMPNMSRLGTEGIWGTLTSPSQWTWECWPTFATGLRPQQHGIIDGSKPRSHLWTLADVNAEAFLWNYLEPAGLSFGISRIPVVTTPPGPPAMAADAENWMISGDNVWPQAIWPADLGQYLLPKVGLSKSDNVDEVLPGRPIVPPGSPVPSAEVLAQKHDEIKYFLAVKSRRNWQTLVACMRQRPVDVAVAYWHDTDYAGHHLLYREDDMRWFYHRFDRWLGQVLDEFAPEAVAVFGDHGMVPFDHPEAQPPIAEEITIGGNRFWRTSGAAGDVYFTGAHRPPSGLILWGRGFSQGTAEMRMEDMMPTLLAKLGISINTSTIDGQVDYSVLGPAGATSQDEEVVIERLRDLGYVE